MMFVDGNIDGIVVRDLKRFTDARGWLVEIFRQDELEPELYPAMGYISMTEVGVARGPHEHVEQADIFAFLGPSMFEIFLWDNRRSSATYKRRKIIVAGEQAPKSIVIPPGVVHAYRNVGATLGMVVNIPNRLYAGNGKREVVDEIRHEEDPDTVFKLGWQ
jgi:dTDP-4-dehydrorhamnose 3,5-epimerase